VKSSSVWGQITWGSALFIGELNLLIAKADSEKIPAQIDSKSQF
jgi:hypothetical protein